ncbi:hypothetical protein B0H14DRAFT_2635286 [Mycena olivaceomarginata]|nr:hypothetical protein B0H14DRAFT_2635286 [Mycena olivaceomarginata]
MVCFVINRLTGNDPISRFSVLQLQSWIQNVKVEVAHTAAGARPLKSSFILNAPAINATTVTLFLANQTADCATGIRTFPWSSENAVPAMLQDEHMSRGKPKVVFKGLAYVAKRCYTVGRGTLVSILVNRDEIVKEGITLVVVNISSTNSRRSVRRRKAISPRLLTLLKDFEVTDFILAREGIIGSEEGSEKPTFIPSPASGINKMEYIGLLDGEKDESVVNNMVISSITWLLEPERGKVHFRNFSATLEHPHYSDKQGATINLFKHFAYI